MGTSRTIAILQFTRGGITVITGQQSGRRYAFTWETREQPIDPRDAEQFRNLVARMSECGCTATNSGRLDKSITLFEVVERPLVP